MPLVKPLLPAFLSADKADRRASMVPTAGLLQGLRSIEHFPAVDEGQIQIPLSHGPPRSLVRPAIPASARSRCRVPRARARSPPWRPRTYSSNRFTRSAVRQTRNIPQRQNGYPLIQLVGPFSRVDHPESQHSPPKPTFLKIARSRDAFHGTPKSRDGCRSATRRAATVRFDRPYHEGRQATTYGIVCGPSGSTQTRPSG